MTKKSLPIACLLWLCTGVFGGHRWYLEKSWSAFAYIISTIYFIIISTILIRIEQDPFPMFRKTPVELLSEEIHYFISNGYTFSGTLYVIFILAAYSIPLRLAYDLFWIRSTLKTRTPL
ncbi:NINE protein [Kiloniella majae]|uniref:NINE protein n=1 Tax=Kiloniella majae TaxID=1938558 RepID=UPI000A279077